MSQIHNRSILKEYRKDLRNNGTVAEAVLWKCLQKRKLSGYKFRRQHSVGNYILDFYCPEKRVAIELDGAHHYTESGREYDKIRTEYLLQLNISILRFENKKVFENQSQVLDSILEELNNRIV